MLSPSFCDEEKRTILPCFLVAIFVGLITAACADTSEQGADSTSTGVQSTDEPCTLAAEGSFSLMVCGDLTVATEAKGAGACEDAYIDCVTELCDWWAVFATQEGSCQVIVNIEGKKYPFEVELVAKPRPPNCSTKYLYKPVCGEWLFYVGPDCSTTSCPPNQSP